MKKSFNIHTLLNICLSLCITLLVMIIIVNVVLNNKFIYYYNIVELNLPKSSKLDISTIKANYDYVIEFVQNPNINFHLPTLPYSTEGKIHFEEVRNIFTFLYRLKFILFLTTIIIFILNLKSYDYKFLKWSAILLLILPLVCTLPFLINFDKSFTMFHKLFFNNDYWILDINTDPIINIMPQEFFFHCAIFIIILLTLTSCLLYLIYKLKNKRH